MKNWLKFIVRLILAVLFVGVLVYLVLWIPVLHKLYDPCAYYSEASRCD